LSTMIWNSGRLIRKLIWCLMYCLDEFFISGFFLVQKRADYFQMSNRTRKHTHIVVGTILRDQLICCLQQLMDYWDWASQLYQFQYNWHREASNMHLITVSITAMDHLLGVSATFSWALNQSLRKPIWNGSKCSLSAKTEGYFIHMYISVLCVCVCINSCFFLLSDFFFCFLVLSRSCKRELCWVPLFWIYSSYMFPL
jgi:hypothetical protein